MREVLVATIGEFSVHEPWREMEEEDQEREHGWATMHFGCCLRRSPVYVDRERLDWMRFIAERGGNAARGREVEIFERCTAIEQKSGARELATSRTPKRKARELRSAVLRGGQEEANKQMRRRESKQGAFFSSWAEGILDVFGEADS